MSYLIKIIKSIKELIIVYILLYVTIIMSSLTYTTLGNNDLNKFLSIYCPWIMIFFYIIIIIYLSKKNKTKEKRLNKNNYFPLISLGISISCLLNMIIFKISNPTPNTSIKLPILIISSGLIGPIYEEILFRKIIFNRLKKFNPTKISIIITTTIFALIHLNPLKIFFAFILGLVLNIIYNKYNNIKAPIIVHSSTNIIALFLTEYNINILILSILCLLISIEIIKYQNVNKISLS